MISLAEESIKSRMPVSHWMWNWNKNEPPAEAEVTEAAQIFLQGMGVEGHQVFVAVHVNTQNVHAIFWPIVSPGYFAVYPASQGF